MFIIGGVLFAILGLLVLLYLFIPVLFPQLRSQPTPTPTPVVVVAPTPQPSPIPTPLPSPTPPPPTPVPTPVIIINQPPVIQGVSQQILTGSGFTLSYPENWGVLTCNNSPNFEFDPDNNVDQINVVCSVATKPISVIVQNSLAGCFGETVVVGNHQVVRSVTTTSEYVEYQWCTVTNPVLSITHRVSPSASSVASQIDYSAQIENMIGTLQI